ncbi:MAG: leucine-rich repeat domain-containing protein [[Eubacterium] siraeum]
MLLIIGVTNVTIPNNMDSIYEYAFNDCVNLTNIIIPDSVIIMGYGAFNGCTSLTEIKVASKNANYVSVNGVLYNKNKTTLMHYPAGKKIKIIVYDGVTEIDGCAFKGCTSLYAVTILNGVTA